MVNEWEGVGSLEETNFKKGEDECLAMNETTKAGICFASFSKSVNSFKIIHKRNWKKLPINWKVW